MTPEGGYGAVAEAAPPPASRKRGLSQEDVTNLCRCLAILGFLFVVGGAIFSWLERDAELKKYEQNERFYNEMRDLYEWQKCDEERFRKMDFCKNQEAFAPVLARFFERTGNAMHDMEKWTLFGSAFYVGTLVTTLGYGSHHPITPEGQLFTVAFGMVGIPLMGFVLSHFGRCIVDVWMPLFPCISSGVQRASVLGALTGVFILLGGVLFMHLEGWDMITATYFSSMTLTTVGFGDLAPTHMGSRLASLVFMLLGLGVMASFMAVLQMELSAEGDAVVKRVRSFFRVANSAQSPQSTPRCLLAGGVRL